MYRLRNLTLLDIIILDDDNQPVIEVWPDLAGPAWIPEDRLPLEVINVEHDGKFVPITVEERRWRPVVGLPAPEPGVLLIVSQAIAEAAQRDDLLCPGDVIRDDGGWVLGYHELVRVGGH